MTTLFKRLRQSPIPHFHPFPTIEIRSCRYNLSLLCRSASYSRRILPFNYRLLTNESASTLWMDPKPSYDECVRQLYLTNMFHPMKVGLKNIEALHEALGSPMNKPHRIIVHVTGSNGKGSVAVKSAKILELAGHKVGLFMSPHISSFRERISINGQCISEEQVTQFLPYIYNICKSQHIPATFFELTTALAFLYFDQCEADAVVLEVGIGGRLDATNCISQPAMCIITSIGLEHTAILGNTIEAIATEKAGIIKKGSPIVVGPNVPFELVSNIAKEKEAEGCYVADMTDYKLLSPSRNPHTLQNGIMDYDIENSLIVATAFRLLRSKLQDDPYRHLLPITDQHIQKGTSSRPPCRFEEFYLPVPNHEKKSDSASQTFDEQDAKVHVVLDIAHNPPAMSYLVEKLNALYPKKRKRFVVGFSNDKDVRKCIDSIQYAVDNDLTQIHLVQASTPRAATLEEIWQAVPALRNSMWNTSDRSVSYQVKVAIDQAKLHGEEVIVICGTVFLMCEAREALGIEEARDSKVIAEIAGSGYRSFQDNVRLTN